MIRISTRGTKTTRWWWELTCAGRRRKEGGRRIAKRVEGDVERRERREIEIDMSGLGSG